MPGWATQRRFPRYMVHLSFLYKVRPPTDTGVRTGWTIELSEGEACLELPEYLLPQTPLRLCLQTESRMFEVEGRGSGAGAPNLPGGICHGVDLTPIAPAQRRALRKLLSFASPERRTGLRLPVDLAVTCSVIGQAGVSLHGRVRDIGLEDLLLLLPEVLAQGTALAATLRTTTEPVTVEGHIVWVEPRGVRTPSGLIAHGLQVTMHRRSESPDPSPAAQCKAVNSFPVGPWRRPFQQTENV